MNPLHFVSGCKDGATDCPYSSSNLLFSFCPIYLPSGFIACLDVCTSEGFNFKIF